MPYATPRPTAAIRYPFSGTVVLEIARSGADVAGVVSFHGGLDQNIFRTSGKSHAYALASASQSLDMPTSLSYDHTLHDYKTAPAIPPSAYASTVCL
jgi:hypothetical protein